MKLSFFLFCFVFLSENFQFLEMKFSVYLNRRVFVTTFSDVAAQ